MFNKIKILWAMKNWPKEYIKWRFETAYPNGLFDVISNPIQFLKDSWAFISWCENIDSKINRKIN
ncbi:MAG: hypothetical protein CBD21_03010 [bacterium TMED161]|nr:MAG: hypothetical protein CBD21_03010 [bacterium TMED161]|tara:strand:+ start:17439 stop:17633 length:195 start_codon:yes stop_codon:yes gene_type:complete